MMPKPRFYAAVAALGLLGAGLTACSTGFQADVSRFQAQLPPPQGQSFAVVADDPELVGGIEFRQYAAIVTQEMAQLGYTPGNPETADLIVRFDYDVDNGRERVRTTGFRGDPFFNPWFGYGGGVFVPRGAWGFGFHDPWLRGGGADVRSFTVYTSEIEIDIDDARTGERLFEGTASAVSRSNRLQHLVPNLVDAMFTDFPGNSGETVRISIQPEDR